MIFTTYEALTKYTEQPHKDDYFMTLIRNKDLIFRAVLHSPIQGTVAKELHMSTSAFSTLLKVLVALDKLEAIEKA